MVDTETKVLIARHEEVETTDVLTAIEAAEILDIQHISVLKALERETLKGQKIGGRWYILRSDIERYRERER